MDPPPTAAEGGGPQHRHRVSERRPILYGAEVRHGEIDGGGAGARLRDGLGPGARCRQCGVEAGRVGGGLRLLVYIQGEGRRERGIDALLKIGVTSGPLSQFALRG